MAKATTWVVTTGGPQALAAVERAVAAAGGTVSSKLGELGVLIVQGTAAQAKAWRKLPGVVEVAADSNVDIGPPDAGVS